MKKSIKSIFIFLIVSLLLLITKSDQLFFILTATVFSFISSFSLITILPLILLKEYIVVLLLLPLLIIITILRFLQKKLLIKIIVPIYIIIITFITHSYLVAIISLIPSILIVLIALNSINDRCKIIDYNIIRIAISSILICNIFLSDIKYKPIFLLPIIIYISYYFEKYISIILSSLCATIFVFSTPLYSIIFIILIPILYIIDNKNKKVSINTDIYIKYFDILKKYLINTSEFSITINDDINNMVKNYCLKCENYKSCSKNTLQYYSYLYTAITSNSFNNKPYNNNMKKYILTCPNSNKFLLNKRPLNNIDFNIGLLTEITNNISIYDNFIEKSLSKRGIQIDGLYVSDNLITIPYNSNYLDNIALLEHILHHKLEYRIIDNEVYLYKPTKYKLDIEAHSISKDNTKLCGDSYKIIDLGYRQIIALSDGMGYGFDAYQQSNQTINLVNNLSNLKLNTSLTMSLIKNSFLYKNNKDSYATLDYLDIDLITAEASLFKFASTSTFIIRNKHIEIYENDNLPLGFDSLSSFYKIKLCRNDLVFIMSDGITEHIDSNELKKILINLSIFDTHKIIYKIINMINKKRLYLLDDITIIAIKII